jgi:hypothetical protein
MLLLLFNLGCRHVKGVKSEKGRYLSQLEFDFSGIVDSPEKKGQALFHVTHGRIDLDKESQLKKQLRFNGLLDLFLYRDGMIDLMIPENIPLKKGDSVYINTNLKVARFFRRGKLISEHPLSKSLRGRPF